MPEIITKKRYTPPKKRNVHCYQRKVNKITKWFNRLLKFRENPKKDNLINPNTKQAPKRKELKDLDYYISKIKKVQGE